MNAAILLLLTAAIGDPQEPKRQAAPPAQRPAAQAPRPQAGRPVPVQAPAAPRANDFRIQQRPSAQLQPRFRDPVANPTHLPPPVPRTHHDHAWRWHHNHGWVLLPPAIAPAALVLPQAFALPQQVVIAEPVALAQPVLQTIICPHCGQQVQLQIR